MANEKDKKPYNPMAYTQAKNPGVYRSAYSQRLSEGIRNLNNARNAVQNFKYDPLSDANYQAMAKVYQARGNQAAQDTLGDAASLNGGFGTSYAVSAAQQARNQYNQELASMIPEYSQQAYNRLTTNYGMLQDTYNLWKDLDTEAYGRYRDRVADYQWGKGYDTDIYQYIEAQKKSSSGGGGGGRRRRSGGGGGGYSGGGGSTSIDEYLRKTYDETKAQVNGSGRAGNPNSVMAYATSKKDKKVKTSYPKK